jgi:hypothetical protein
MSVAFDYEARQFAGEADLDLGCAPVESVPFWPADYLPEPVPYWPVEPVPHPDERPLAGVVELRRAVVRPQSPPVRLTRRGSVVLAAAVAVACAALVSLAWLSAPGSSGSASQPAPGAPSSAATVTVENGDTLWSIAGRVAPGKDPRAEVDLLQRLNALSGAALTPGQTLRTR